MIDNELKDDILNSISLTGAVEESSAVVNPQVSVDAKRLVDYGSGLPRLRRVLQDKFQLILRQPIAISALSNLAVRCTLCKKVISYPCWYYSERFNINIIHYFVCFDSNSPIKPSTKCYKKS